MTKRVGVLAAYFLAANTVADNTDEDKILWAISAAGAAVALYAVAQHLGLDFFPWVQHDDVPTTRGVSTFGHPTFAASFLVLAIPLTTGLLATRRSLLSRMIALTFLSLMCYHFLLTGARGAALAMIAALVTVVIVLIREWDHAAPSTNKTVKGRASRKRILAGTVIVIAIGSLMAFSAWHVKRSDLFAFRQGGGSVRLYTWETATRLFLAHPVTGVGAGNYEVASPPFWNQIERERFVKYDRRSARVHNEYLQTAAEQGVVGVMVFAGLMLTAFYEAYRVVRFSCNKSGRFHGLALLAAVVAAAVDALFIFNLQEPASAFLFWVVLGLITYNVSRARKAATGTE